MNPSRELERTYQLWQRHGYVMRYQHVVKGSVCTACGEQSLLLIAVLDAAKSPPVMHKGALWFLLFDHHSDIPAIFELPLVDAMEFDNRLVDAIAAGTKIIAQTTSLER